MTTLHCTATSTIPWGVALVTLVPATLLPSKVAHTQNRQRLFYFMSMFAVVRHGNLKSLLNAKVLILLRVEERFYGVIIL